MDFLVIGLGSMGKRRIKLLKENFNNINIIGVDKQTKRREECKEKYNIKTYKIIKKAVKENELDAAVICTPPLSHAEIIKECFGYNLDVFTELNLIKDSYKEIINLAKEKDLALFLSSTMIYREETKYIHDRVKKKRERLNYRYHVGQYLPDWHPWESYKDFFVRDKRTNGCREIFAVELPWIIRTFGQIKEVKAFKTKTSSLDINYPDTYAVLLKHKEGHIGSINVDLVARKAVRDFELYSENTHLFWDGSPDGLSEYDFTTEEMVDIDTYKEVTQNDNYSETIIENVYLTELEIFIDKIKDNKNDEKYTFEDDRYTLSVIDQIEGSI